MSLLIGNNNHSSWEHTVEDLSYWPGQMVYISKAEREDADYRYNSWDMDLDK